MPRVSLHGVPISWSFDGSLPDPLVEVLGALGMDEPGEVRSGGLSVVVCAAGAGAAERPDIDGYLPVFFLGVIQAYRDPSGRSFLLWDRASRVIVPLDGSPILAAIAPPDREVTSGSTAAMIHIALAIALRREGLFHLHAAALEHTSGAGVLVAGGSGAGKTTTAMALIEAGSSYLGDDSVFLRALPGEGRGAGEILAFPRVFHVGSATLGAFPRLEKLARRSAGQASKLAIDPREAFPGRALHASALPSVVFFPKVSASSPLTEMAPLSRADAFGQLIASSAAILIEGVPCREENITLLRAVVEAAQSFELRLGRDVLSSPALALSPHLERALAG